MPIYEYRCRECGHSLEAIQKFSDEPLAACPKCGAATGLERLISAPAFRLAGGGWYETDFKKDGQRNLAKSEPSGSGEGTAGACGAPACGAGGCASNVASA
ncbi:MAG: FmdB family zinc ribbon protein [Thioalkalivibrionaceae bacterium]